jgi:hypothetical protein
VPSRARADLEQQERTARGPPHRLKRGEASGQSGSPEDGHEALWRNRGLNRLSTRSVLAAAVPIGSPPESAGVTGQFGE